MFQTTSLILPPKISKLQIKELEFQVQNQIHLTQYLVVVLKDLQVHLLNDLTVQVHKQLLQGRDQIRARSRQLLE